MSRSSAVLLSLLLAGLVGCPSEPYGAAPGSAKTSPTKTSPTKASPTKADPLADPSAEAEAAATDDRRPHFVSAGDGPVVEAVLAASKTAARDDCRLVVYVGASWCEPCTAFHEAVERGELDEALAGVRFLEFDSDRVGDQLPGAGYGGRYIPRFTLPGPDGRGSDRTIEGGIKGVGAVDHIMQRLGPLLAPAGS